jgi:hypothetical protein
MMLKVWVKEGHDKCCLPPVNDGLSLDHPSHPSPAVFENLDVETSV